MEKERERLRQKNEEKRAKALEEMKKNKVTDMFYSKFERIFAVTKGNPELDFQICFLYHLSSAVILTIGIYNFRVKEDLRKSILKAMIFQI